MPFGPETQIATTANYSLFPSPDVASLAGGGYVLTWTDYAQGVLSQRYSDSGAAVGGVASVDPAGIKSQISALADGGYVIAAQERHDGQDWITLKTYAADGAAEASQTLGLGTRAGAFSVLGLGGGHEVVAWNGWNGTFVQVLDASLGALGAPVQVTNTSIGSLPGPLGLSALANGGFVLGWKSSIQVSTETFDADGHPTHPVSAIDDHLPLTNPDVLGLPGGGYLVAYQGPYENGVSDIRLQHYDSAGNAVGSAVVVAPADGLVHTSPSIAALSNGGYVVGWVSFKDTQASPPTVWLHAQAFAADGTRTGDAPLLEQDLTLAGHDPRLAGLSDGRYVATWRQDTTQFVHEDDPFDETVELRLITPNHVVTGAQQSAAYDLSANDLLRSTSASEDLLGFGGSDTVTYRGVAAGVHVDLGILTPQDTGGGGVDQLISIENLIGSDHADALVGDDKANRLDGGKGDDTLTGGIGDDVFVVDSRGDKVIENVGEGRDTVQTGLSGYVAPDNVENLTLRYADNIAGTGNGLANILTGNGGANLLKGLGGADTLLGGEGADTLIGGSGADVVTGGGGADVFQYASTSEIGQGGERITDFSAAEGDKIDLHLIDANTVLANDQAFSFIGAAFFSHTAGELRSFASGGSWLVQGDVNGDGVADFTLTLNSQPAAGDFIL